MDHLYYKPSGKVSISFFIFSALFLLFSIPILSIAYIYLIHYIPFVYANILITIGCGCVVGFIFNLASKLGKARNSVVVIICTIIAMCFLKYLQWCVYIPMVFSKVYGAVDLTFGEVLVESAVFFVNPAGVFEYVALINEYGVWSIRDIVVTGVFLAIVWVIEFLLMTGAAVLVSLNQPKFPFSEKSNGWYKKMPEKIDIDVPQDFNALVENMENGDFSGLIRLAKEEKEDEMNFLRLTFCQPPQDSSDNPYYISIDQITVTNDNEDKQKENSLVEYLSINHEVVGEIIQKPKIAVEGVS